jgi:hypothetical protein
MNAEDSSGLLDTTAAAKLGVYQALLVDDKEGRQEEFRPYNGLEAVWLAEVGRQLSRR